MKFLTMIHGDGVRKFALDSVMEYSITALPKYYKGKDDRYAASVTLKPIKQLDSDSYGKVVDVCEKFTRVWSSLELASGSIWVEDI